MTVTDYFKISALCEPVESKYVKYSCYTDPTGLTDGVSITASYYDNDQCLGGQENIDHQDGFFLSEFHTYCNKDVEDFFDGGDLTLSGSEIFKCLVVEDDQLPFKTDAENTYVKVLV